MTYYILFVFFVFSLFAFGAEDENNKSRFVLDGATEKRRSFLSEDLRYVEEETKNAEGRGDAVSMLGLYVMYRSQSDTRNMRKWLEELKDIADSKGNILALTMIYRITGQVLWEGYMVAVRNVIRNLPEEERDKLRKTGKHLKEIRNGIMETIKSPFVAGSEGIKLVLYNAYHAKKDEEKAKLWLDKIKSEADKGNISALRALYNITGVIYEKGYEVAVNKSLFPEVMNRSSVIDAKDNMEKVRNSIKERITKPVGNCEFSFSVKSTS